MITSILTVVVVIAIIGIIAWLIGRAPFINAEFKTIINYVLLVIAVIYVIYFLYALVSGNGSGIIIR
jgi:hypothetical protein